MCTHSRYIYNRYTKKYVLVACGKCEACKQEKAQRRTNRIRNNAKVGYLTLFVTLTYSPDFLPYVYRSDVGSGDCFINVYRKFDIRHYKDRVIKYRTSKPVAVVSLFDDSKFGMLGLKSPTNGNPLTFSVIVYNDVKKFFKRLRINLKRKYNYDNKINYFACSEYGSLSHRAHHHLLIQCEASAVEKVRSAIVASWSYADPVRTEKYIEISKDASSYVSSYVNSSHTLPEILTSHAFRQKHSYSKNYGVSLQCFSLDSLLEKFERNDFSYTVETVKDGVRSLVDIPVPEYVVNRFFPKVKGYFLLSPSEIRKLLLLPLGYASTISAKCVDYGIEMSFSMDEVQKYRVRFLNLFDNHFKDVFGTFENFCKWYPDLYVSFRSRYACFLNKMAYESVYASVGLFNYYENIQDLYLGYVHSDIVFSEKFVLDPNKRLDVVNKSSRFTQLYHKMDKSRKVNNIVLQHDYM